MKRSRFVSKQFVILILAVLTLAGVPAQVAAEQDCSATLTPEVVSIAAGSAEITVMLSEGIGAVSGVDVDAESGLNVLGIEADDGQMLEVSIDTSAATAGSWELYVQGESGSCNGTLQVTFEARG